MDNVNSLQNNDVQVYCDGACIGNPGPGGWAVVLPYSDNNNFINKSIIEQDSIKSHVLNDQSSIISGGEDNTTNNRMELMAAIMSLQLTFPKNHTILYTDSLYVQRGMTQWIYSWMKNDWKKGKIKNIDLWHKLILLSKNRSITWKWVRGHSGNKYNDIADKYAKEAAKTI